MTLFTENKIAFCFVRLLEIIFKLTKLTLLFCLKLCLLKTWIYFVKLSPKFFYLTVVAKKGTKMLIKAKNDLFFFNQRKRVEIRSRFFFLEKYDERDMHMILKRIILWQSMLCYPMLWYGMKCTLIYGVSMLWISMVCYAMVYVVKDMWWRNCTWLKNSGESSPKISN